MKSLDQSTSAVVLAAGQSTRMGGSGNKVLLDLCGRSVLEHSVEVFAGLPEIREILLVVSTDELKSYLGDLGDSLRALGVKKIVPGGARRSDSSGAGVSACHPDSRLILIHDGARPFPPPQAIRLAIRRAEESGAAILAVPLKDTLKRSGPGGLVAETVDRERLYCAQTPQVFQRDLLEKARLAADEAGLAPTDDAALIEATGGQVALIEGDPANLKITTPEDLRLARAIISSQNHNEDTRVAEEGRLS